MLESSYPSEVGALERARLPVIVARCWRAFTRCGIGLYFLCSGIVGLYLTLLAGLMEFERLFFAYSWALVPTIGAFVLLCYDVGCPPKVKTPAILLSLSYPLYVWGPVITPRFLPDGFIAHVFFPHDSFPPFWLLWIVAIYYGLYGFASLYLLFLLFRDKEPTHCRSDKAKFGWRLGLTLALVYFAFLCIAR
jgi:hypothetical protein